MELGILIFCCIRNYFRARAANLNAALWTFYTLLASLIAWFIGGVIVTLILLARYPQIKKMLLQQPPDREGIISYMAGQNLFVAQIFLVVCMLGGYLFVRHLLLRKIPLE